MVADGSPQTPTPVRTTEQPPEGLRSCLVPLDFTTTTVINVDFLYQVTQHQISAVRTLYVDNYDNLAPLTVFFLESQQRIVVPAKTQIYIPVLTASQCNVQFTTTGALILKVHALNFLLNPFRLGDTASGGGAGPVTIEDEGSAVVTNTALINFIGAGVTANQSAPGAARVIIPGLSVLDEGTALANAISVNFVGAGVTATNVGPGQVQVAIPGTSTPLHVLDEGVDLGVVSSLNFVGAGVTASGANAITVAIPAPTIQAQDEGSPVVNATAINFVGAGVVCTMSAPGVAQVAVQAGGIQSVEVQQGGVLVGDVQTLNFVGQGVTATLQSAGVAAITIPTPVSTTRLVRAIAGGNVNLAAPGAGFDGVTFANGDRVFLGLQTNLAENGIYDFNGAAAPLTRSSDSATSAQMPPGLIIRTTEGALNARTSYTLVTPAPIVLGTTPLTFTWTSALMPDGSAATPAIAFKAEQSTGWRRVAAGVVAVCAAGVDLLQTSINGISWDGINFLKGFIAFGPYTPLVKFGGANVGMVLPLNVGFYCALGPLVFFMQRIDIGTLGTSTGQLSTTVPIVSNATANTHVTFAPVFSGTTAAGNANGSKVLGCILTPGTSELDFFALVNGALTAITNADLLANVFVNVGGFYFR